MRTSSWLQIVRTIDPDRDTREVVVYLFGNGKKKFKEKRDPYKN